MALFSLKALIKFEKQMLLIICYKQEDKMRAGKMNNFCIDLEEKNCEHSTILKDTNK